MNSVLIIYPKEITWTTREKDNHFLSGKDDYITVFHSEEYAGGSVGEQFQCPYCKQFMVIK